VTLAGDVVRSVQTTAAAISAQTITADVKT